MPTAVVLGGGIAGLSAGIALIRAGWDVTVLERAATLEPVGGALSLWPNATDALARLGVLDAVRARAMPFTRLLLADSGGRPIVGPRATDGLALIVTRADLQAALVDALPGGRLQLAREVVAVGEGAVTLADGARIEADLIVDAGGIRSIAGQGDATYRGYGGVVALSDPLAGGLDGLGAEYWGTGERFGVFEITRRRRYWFYMRDQVEGAVAPTHDEAMRRAEGWPASVAAAIAATPPARLTPFAVHAGPSPRSLGGEGVLRVGDAAHAMEPNLGQGACQAIEDAIALGAVARALPVDAIVPAMERLRLKRIAFIVDRSAEGRHGVHGNAVKQQAVRTAMRLIPATITGAIMRRAHTLPSYKVAP